MAIPEYDPYTLPVIETPYDDMQEATKKYLGGRAITGQEYANINLFAEDDSKIKALYEFWRDDCEYGTLQFMAPLPIHGSEHSRYVPNALCEFLEDVSMEKQDVHWKQGVKLKVIEYSANTYTIVDDAGNLMVDDSGNVLASTSAPISNSNKEITYG